MSTSLGMTSKGFVNGVGLPNEERVGRMQKRLPLPVETILQGRYRIIRQLRAGAMGAVYEANDMRLKNRLVALKETFADDDQTRQAFKREAELLANIEHEAFPTVTDYFTQDDGCFLVMELIRGDDLDELLRKRAAPFEQEQVLTWADQILDALEELHASGIVHRDIKPSNLKLTPKGKIKLLDFGIAKGNLEGETTLLVGMGSIAAATLRFAPLEQILKANPDWHEALSVSYPQKTADILQRGTDASSDLYALAATLYQLLTNHLPVNAPTRALALWAGAPDKLHPAHKVNAQVSREVSDVLQKAMKIDRRERPVSAVEMRRMLKEAIKPVASAEPTLILNNFAEPDTKPISQPFKTEPIKLVSTNEIPRSLDLPKSTDNPKNSLRLYVVLIALPVLLVIIGLSVYFNQSSNNASNSASNTQAANSKYKLVQTLIGHSDLVGAVAFSPDGKTIASGDWDNVIKLWDAASGKFKQTLTGHSSTISSVTYSLDGKTIASGSLDGIKLWDADSGTLRQTLNGHTYVVISVAFSPDSRTVASGSVDKTIKLWDAMSGTLKQTLTEAGEVRSVAFSPNGKMLASGSDKTIKIWDTTDGSLMQTLAGDKYVNSVAFSPDGKTIVSGSQDETIIWDMEKGILKQTFKNRGGGVLEAAFSPDGKLIASGNVGWYVIEIWDVESGILKQTLEGHEDGVWSVAFSPDGKMIASGSKDKTIKLWRIE